MRKSILSLSVIATTALLLVSCGPSTKIENSWTDPSVTPSTFKPFQKVLYVAQLNNDANRRIAEDRLVAQSNGHGVASYSYLSPGDTSEATLNERLKNDGFDGIVVMKITDVEKEQNYTSNSYGGWYVYYRYAGPMYTTGSTYTTKTYYVQTNVFSLTDNKLLWSGTTSSVDPSKVDKTVDQIVSVIRADLKKKGFIKS